MAAFDRKKGEPACILALAAGASERQAAAESGLGDKTVRRRMAEPEYRAEVSRLRSELLGRTAGRLADTAAKAAWPWMSTFEVWQAAMVATG